MADKIRGITIEIGGDVQPLNKALEEVNKKSKDIQSELRQVERLLKLDPQNTELLAQKQKLLAEAVENTKSKLETLKEAERQVQEQFKRGEIGEEQYRAIQREVIATEQQLKKLEDQLKEINNKWKDAAESVEEFGKKATDIGKEMSLKVTTPILGAATASMVAWGEVDEALDTIVKKTGLTGEQLEELQESFRNVAKTMPADMQSIGIAIGEVNTRFQVTGQELEDLTKLFIQFAEINETDLNAAIGATQRIMSQWNIETSRVSEVLGTLTNEAQYSGISIEKLMDSIQKNGAVLKEMGFSLGDSITLLGEFERNGINTEIALTALRRAIANFAKDGKTTAEGLRETAEAIKNAKTETEALSIATEVFGTRGAAEMVKAIREGRLEFREFGLEMEEFGDVVSLTFEGTLDPVDKFTVAMNNLKLVGSDIGTVMQETITPILDILVAKLQNFTDWFRNLSPAIQQAIVIIGGIAAAIGPLLIIIGQMATGLSSIINLFGSFSLASGTATAAVTGTTAATGGLSAVIGALTGPIGIAIAAITAITAVIVTLWKTNEDFRENVKKIWEQIKEIFNLALSSIKNLVTDIFNAIKSFIERHGEDLKKIINGAWDAISSIINTALKIIQGLLDTFIGLFTGDWNRFTNGIKTTWSSMWEGIRSIVASAWNILSGAFNILKNSISGWFKDLINDALEWGRNLLTSFIDGIKSKISAVKDAVSGVVGTVADYLGFHSPAKKGPGRYIVDWGYNMIEGFIEGINKAIPQLQSTLNAALPNMSQYNSTYNTNNNFVVHAVIREESDIRKVAQEIYRLQQQASRGKGLVWR